MNNEPLKVDEVTPESLKELENCKGADDDE